MAKAIETALLIDDEEVDQKTYGRVLKRSGLVREYRMFTYAEDALDYLKANPGMKIDVIFLDINMPRMNGFEFLDAASEALGADFARMVVVMLTTSIDPMDRRRAKENPLVKAFFDKPLTEQHVERVAGLLVAD